VIWIQTSQPPPGDRQSTIDTLERVVGSLQCPHTHTHTHTHTLPGAATTNYPLSTTPYYLVPCNPPLASSVLLPWGAPWKRKKTERDTQSGKKKEAKTPWPTPQEQLFGCLVIPTPLHHLHYLSLRSTSSSNTAHLSPPFGGRFFSFLFLFLFILLRTTYIHRSDGYTGYGPLACRVLFLSPTPCLQHFP
jgi:hypothetical protein